MTYILIAAVAVWWTIAVALFGIIAGSQDISDDAGEWVAFSIFWPITATLYLFVILWRIQFKSAKAIRHDLKNRKLIREFDEWHRGRIVAKEEAGQ